MYERELPNQVAKPFSLWSFVGSYYFPHRRSAVLAVAAAWICTVLEEQHSPWRAAQSLESSYTVLGNRRYLDMITK